MKRILACALAALAVTSLAMWVMPPHRDVPIARLLANLSQQATKQPKSAEINYELGRIHSMALSQDKLDHYGTPGKDLKFVPWSSVQTGAPQVKKLNATHIDHLVKSLVHYRKALELDPKNDLYRMGLAYMHEVAIPHAKQLPKLAWLGKSVPTSARLKQESVKLYREIYKRNRAEEMVMDSKFEGSGDAYLGMEAGTSILRVLGPGISAAEKKDIEVLIKTIDSKPRVVTPIILPLTQDHTFARLINPTARVAFDLAGDGVSRAWPWVTSQAGILVWDPRHNGRITSGQQLFGSATFWMLYRDGYAAMASLDNNGDGWLSGAELQGIAIWRDRNVNGISEPGEVQPLTVYGVVGIRTKPSNAAGVLSANRGVVFRDGRVAPTYDWTPTSHPIATTARK